VSRFKRDRLVARAPSPIQNVSRDTSKTADEISCLLARGFSEQHLDETRRRAYALRVSPAHLLIRGGQIGETDFYRCYAHAVGAPFAEIIPKIAHNGDWQTALRSGHARLADGRWLIAPQGRALKALTDRLSRTPRHDVLLTSPSLFRAAMAQQFSQRIVKHAAQHLSRSDASASAQSGVSNGQKRVIAGLLGLICFGVVDGGVIWALCCAIFSAAVAFGVIMRFAGAFRALARPQQTVPPLPEARLPDYTVLVPLYREANMLPSLIMHLQALDYPVERHEILLLIEEDDVETRAALSEMVLPPHMQTIIVPAGFPRTKPRALNVGLLQAQGECLVVYDAEDRPERDQLKKAAAIFAQAHSRLACLQASLAIDNARENWLTRLFALDYASHFDVLHWGHSRLAMPLPLGGTSNHFRTSCLRDVGGWDAWNVTEDADLGLRLARHGLDCRMLASTTWEEAPPTLRDWLPQRRRWMKGWMQTFLTHTRHPLALWREVGTLRAAHILALLIANTFGPLVGIWFTVYVLWHAWLGDLPDARDSWSEFAAGFFWTSLAATGFVSIVIPTLMGAGRRHLWTCLSWLALRPAYWVCMSIAGLQALIEIVRNPFHWAKTRHGLGKKRLNH
jgi:cellulose synthase/poly-beta-1,6-N-acetylglucosamine synthase-like glycosyltransferase